MFLLSILIYAVNVMNKSIKFLHLFKFFLFNLGYSFKYLESGASFSVSLSNSRVVWFLNSEPQKGGSCSQGLRNVRRGFFIW